MGAITFYEKERIFQLDTPKSTYVIGIVDEENFVGHVYYGKKIKDGRVGYLLRTAEAPFVPSQNNRERVSFLDSFPMEYPGKDAQGPALFISREDVPGERPQESFIKKESNAR